MEFLQLRKKYLLAVVLLLFCVTLGSASVLAQTGSITSSAVASDETPNVGDQITVSVSIDMTNVDAPDNALGSYTGSLDWNPAVLEYVNYTGAPPAGFSGVTNVNNVSSGNIIFNGANASGATGELALLTVTFDVIGAGSGELDLSYSAMAAAFTFKDLLPLATINVDTVEASEAPPAIVINEIIQDPSKVTDANGEWFELHNPTSEDVDVNGWTISDNGIESHSINNGGPLVIPAGGYLVLARNGDSGINGGVNDDYEYSGFTLGNADDEVILQDQNLIEVDRVEYDGGPEFPSPAGASMSLISPSLDNNVGTNWCVSTTPFGAGDLGTPGAANTCEPVVLYELTITVAPAESGTTVPEAGSHTYSEGLVVDLTATPASGYEFDHWTGDVADPDAATTTVTMDGDKTVTAYFTQTGIPPQTPSSFYGEIHVFDNPPEAGGVVDAYVTGVVDAVASTFIAEDTGNLVYTINVPSDDGSGAKNGGVEGDVVTFKIDDRIVAAGVWHGGTNVLLDFHPPQALTGGPYTGTVDVPIAFHGSANDWGSDAATYEWDWNNDGVYDESGQNPSHTWTDYGDYTVNLKVTDAQGGEGTAVLTVAVNNEAPVLESIGDKTVNELVQLTFTASASDPDPLTFSLVGAPTGASITTDGDFSWTPGETQGPGNYTFTVKVCDDGTPSLCDEEEITVTVNEVNVAPVLNAVGDKTVDEGVALSFTASATDTDIPVTPLTFSLGGAAPAGASITTDGDFSWTPTETQGPNDYAFDVCVSDGLLSDCETITVTVNEANVAPDLDAIGDKTVDEGSELTFTATATDADLPANNLTFSLDDEPSGAVITAGGLFSWTPTEAHGPAAHTFDVCVTDGLLDDCETITVTVNEVNVAPVLDTIGNKSVTEGSELAFTAAATDADLPLNTLTFTLEDAPVGVSITAGGSFSWTPTDDQGPADYTFDVCVSDGLLFDCETITVSVNDAIVTHSISLVPGWNLVSFNVHPADTEIAVVLLSIAGNYDLVYAWDATGAHSTNGNWMKYDPTAPEYSNTLSELDETMGFWVHMTAVDTLEVVGIAPETTDINLSVNAGGWNLVAYPSAVNRTMPGALSDHGVGDDFSLVYAYHADDVADPWKLFDVSSPVFASDLQELSSGWGYWIKVDADSTWSVKYLAD